MKEDLLIRPINRESRADYEALAAFYAMAYPEERSTARGLMLADGVSAPELVRVHYLAESGGEICGVGAYENWKSPFQPHKFLLHVIVATAFRRQGIGAALYEHVNQEIEALNPEAVRALIDKDSAASVRFAEKRGFSPVLLKWNLLLKVQECDLSPYESKVAQLAAEGIEIKPVTELYDEEERDRKLYDVYIRTMRALKTLDPPEIPTFAEFIEEQTIPIDDFTYVAIHRGQFVGMWQLENTVPFSLYGGIMAVEESYRRKGVALGLAVRAIKFAQKFKYTTLIVHTDENNDAILTLTDRLGFTHLPTQLVFSKQLKSENN